MEKVWTIKDVQEVGLETGREISESDAYCILLNVEIKHGTINKSLIKDEIVIYFYEV